MNIKKTYYMNEIIYGFHAINALFHHNPSCFNHIFIINNNKNERISLLIQAVQLKGIKIYSTNKIELNKITNFAAHQGIAANIKVYNTHYNKINDIYKLKTPLLLILDNITDPQNLGACLRTANAAGVDAVIIPKHKSATLNGVARKVACGAADYTPLITVNNLTNTIIKLKNIVNIIGATSDAINTIYESQLTTGIAIIMGSEHKGIRPSIKKYCDCLMRIPMYGNISSLNISVATAICLYEAIRQRKSL
uniref:23S rRNA (Guanosine(2251)-2'-O)-methyltransferase RlmB n=1 Tax=Candidatus Aschnera chinzeii TaxID=1485666 RepID=A0AAT9G439_9ENTR|nr:MAG: 23S rRNA (guanosine(2251)-2'-O)-methyltransferase RlmB [Candidatus Aschnera chinzeii]